MWWVLGGGGRGLAVCTVSRNCPEAGPRTIGGSGEKVSGPITQTELGPVTFRKPLLGQLGGSEGEGSGPTL